MLAISLGFSNEPRLRLPSTRKIFADRAKSFIDDEGMTPSVATVQALAHLASYHSLAAEHNLGWLYIGMALRCAVARESTSEARADHQSDSIPMSQGYSTKGRSQRNKLEK
jgi:hypothetical protein